MNQHESESLQMQQRREVLRRAAWLLGGAISAPAALAILQGCSARDAPAAAAWQPKFLQGDEPKVISALADIIIPRTETSGALDANVPAFIDLMLADVYATEVQLAFREGCRQFAAAGDKGREFLAEDRPAQTTRVRQALEAALAPTGNTSSAQPHGQRPFILMARELTLLGFYTSQPGITENMDYQPVPQVFRGCVPVSQLKKPVYWE